MQIDKGILKHNKSDANVIVTGIIPQYNKDQLGNALLFIGYNRRLYT